MAKINQEYLKESKLQDETDNINMTAFEEMLY